MRRANNWQRRRWESEEREQNEPAPLNITIDLTEDDEEESSVSPETRSSNAPATQRQNIARSSSSTWEVINLCGEPDSVRVDRVRPSVVARSLVASITLDCDIEELDFEDSNVSPDPPKLCVEKPQPSCPICFNDLVDADTVLVTKCGHMYCKDCILSSLEIQRVCPLCRQKVSKNQLIPVYLNAK